MTHFYNPDNREYKKLLDGVNARTYWGKNLMLAVVDLDANSIVPNHSHPHEQGGIVLEGEMRFTIAGETRELKPGDLYIIPGGVEHGVIIGNQPARVLDIFSPIREEYKY